MTVRIALFISIAGSVLLAEVTTYQERFARRSPDDARKAIELLATKRQTSFYKTPEGVCFFFQNTFLDETHRFSRALSKYREKRSGGFEFLWQLLPENLLSLRRAQLQLKALLEVPVKMEAERFQREKGELDPPDHWLSQRFSDTFVASVTKQSPVSDGDFYSARDESEERQSSQFLSENSPEEVGEELEGAHQPMHLPVFRSVADINEQTDKVMSGNNPQPTPTIKNDNMDLVSLVSLGGKEEFYSMNSFGGFEAVDLYKDGLLFQNVPDEPPLDTDDRVAHDAESHGTVYHTPRQATTELGPDVETMLLHEKELVDFEAPNLSSLESDQDHNSLSMLKGLPTPTPRLSPTPEQEKEAREESEKMGKDLPSLIERISRHSIPEKMVDELASLQKDFPFQPEGTMSARMLTSNLDGEATGRLLGKMLLWDSFGCMDIPTLSLMAFRLFYFGILPRTSISDFFSGFFGHLNQAMEQRDTYGQPTYEAKYARKMLRDYFGVNLYVILGAESELADALFEMLLIDPDNRREDFQLVEQNFVELFSFVLELVVCFERHRDNGWKILARGVAKLEFNSLKKAAGGSLILAIIWLEFLLSKWMLPFSWAVKREFKKLTKPYSKRLQRYLRDNIPGIDKDQQAYQAKVSHLIDEIAKGFKKENLENFLGHFEQAVANFYGCPMCKIRGKIHTKQSDHEGLRV